MKVNLIIDGNYLVHKVVHPLHKNNILFGSLYKSLEISISNYRKMYPFSNIYLVSDSRDKSWRKSINPEYKATRKKDSDIDWKFVYETYGEFKKDVISNGIKVLESSGIEGDDWVAFLINESNKKSISTFVVSNDYDIKQELKYNISPLWINIMSNEMANKLKVFLPKNYQIFINEVSKLDNDDIFNLNDNNEFLNLIKTINDKFEVVEIDYMESLFIKVISGDISDNIKSVWSVTKNGKTRGIGDKGAKNIIDSYQLEFGDLDISDPDIYENIADIICEMKKLSKSSIENIKNNIIDNMKLIHLDMGNLPKFVIDKMESEYERL